MRFMYPAAAAALLFAGSADAATKYTGWQSTIKYSKTATAAAGFKNGARITTTVVYDAATDTYTLRDTGSPTLTSSFGPADVDAGASDATFTVYEKVSGSTTETLRLLNQDPANPLIVLSYVDYGQWRRATTSSGTTSINDTYVVFGTKTARADMPHSGTGSYNTILDGTFIDKTGNYAVSGTGTFDANFASGTISYSSTASATPETIGTGFSFGTMTGSGSIAFNSSSFRGTGVTNGSGYSMGVNGGFYGPGAAEIGGVFTLKGNGGNGTGAIVGN